MLLGFYNRRVNLHLFLGNGRRLLTVRPQSKSGPPTFLCSSYFNHIYIKNCVRINLRFTTVLTVNRYSKRNLIVSF